MLQARVKETQMEFLSEKAVAQAGAAYTSKTRKGVKELSSSGRME